MKSSRASWSARLAAALLVAGFSCATALAKKEVEQLPPYDVQAMQHQSVWIQWVFAFLFVAGVTAIAIKNPHRTHLD